MDSKKLKKQLDEIFSRRLSQQSIELLQTALAEYVEIDLVNVYDCAPAEIQEVIGEEISRSTIEGFAKNRNRNKPGENFFSTPRMQRYFADFLTALEVITPDDLRRGDYNHAQAALRLADFFGTKDDAVCQGYPGTFHYSPHSSDEIGCLIKLVISVVQGHSILSIIERSFKSKEHRLNWEIDRLLEVPPNTYKGWGVFLKPDAMFLFLRSNREETETKTYSLVSTPIRTIDTNRVVSFHAFENNELIEIEAKDKADFDQIDEKEFRKKVIHFQRDVDFSGKQSQNVIKMSEDDRLTDEERKKRRRELKKKRLGKTRLLATGRVPPEIEPMEEREVMKEKFSRSSEQEKLGKRLYRAARDLHEEKVRALVGEGAPVNYIDPQTGNTPIFPLAIWERWDTVQFLLDTGECNLLIRNKRNRLLSTRIGEETGNMEWASKVRAIELEQGRKQGIIPRIRGDDPIDPDPT